MSQDRIANEFAIFYSYNLEKMNESFNSRLSKACSFGLIVLGSSVIGQFGNPAVVGLSVAVLSALQLVFRFGEVAGSSRTQKERYTQLMRGINSLSDDELLKRMDGLMDNNCLPLTSLEMAAYNKALIQLGRESEPHLFRRLPFLSACIVFIAGGYPVYPVPLYRKVGKRSPCLRAFRLFLRLRLKRR